MIRADIETEVAPIVGTEKQSEEMVHYLLQEFEGTPPRSGSPTFSGNPSTSWWGGPEHQGQADAGGRPGKAWETLQRIINEGSGGLICIIL